MYMPSWTRLLPPFERKTRVLFVCTQNICRSPLAEGLLRHHLRKAGLARKVKVHSAGTKATMPGARPDQRALNLAQQAGVSLSGIRATRVTEKLLAASDYCIAMDRSNERDLLQVCPVVHRQKISLLLSHIQGGQSADVPDPYYGSLEDFREVYDLIERGVLGLLQQLSETG